ncbi:hypothetical protein M8J76_010655 [Diaphorina citri]|nr:hypothetical protein M8J76_010655 [Diaphorina citri]
MYTNAVSPKIEPNRYYCHYGFRNPYKRDEEDTSTENGDRKSIRCDANYVRLFLKNWEWRDIFHEYTQNSSLHGLRYMGNTELHIAERMFWIISFIMAIIASVLLISNLYAKWIYNPVIISLSPIATPLTAIPFPAITICNMNNVQKSIALAIQAGNDSESEIEKKLLSDFCDEESLIGDGLTAIGVGEWETVKNFMIKVTQPCDSMLRLCLWHGDPINCSRIFYPSLTDEGMCCAFNKVRNEFIFKNPKDTSELNTTIHYPSVDWTLENDFPENAPVDSIPWRPWGAGRHLGLTVVLDANIEEYFCSSEASYGFKLLLQNPVETPKLAAFGELISPGRESLIVIKPIINKSNPSIATSDPELRQCLFNKERALRFYRHYTQRNCILECEANFTLSFCQCVMYFMPKDRFTRICGKKDTDCADKAKLAMEMRLSQNLSNISKIFNDTTQKPNCGCLPGCFSLGYSKTQSSSTLAENPRIKKRYLAGKSLEYFRKNMAVVHLFFTDTQFTGFVKSELFGFTEFLSNTGGLLGLFLGFSFLSAFEVIYFLTLRLCCIIVRKHNNMIQQNKPYKRPKYPYLP